MLRTFEGQPCSVSSQSLRVEPLSCTVSASGSYGFTSIITGISASHGKQLGVNPYNEAYILLFLR